MYFEVQSHSQSYQHQWQHLALLKCTTVLDSLHCTVIHHQDNQSNAHTMILVYKITVVPCTGPAQCVLHVILVEDEGNTGPYWSKPSSIAHLSKEYNGIVPAKIKICMLIGQIHNDVHVVCNNQSHNP